MFDLTITRKEVVRNADASTLDSILNDMLVSSKMKNSTLYSASFKFDGRGDIQRVSVVGSDNVGLFHMKATRQSNL